ncbi:MAG TPA: hypothetical protein VK851_02965, partial [Anaerolineales bacterium]|nr:hypothetical protein [Anaerolineales bacterium]
IRLTRRLLLWSALSVLVSILIAFSSNLLLRGLAIQFFAWGAVDGAIAIYGARRSTNKQANIQEADRVEAEAKEARWLSRVLWINTGLDVFYILGGVWLMQTWGADDPLWKGHGLGIVIQGGFLFFFDLYHAFALRN